MDEKLMKDAQYRKGLGIAFFNANNAAMEWAKINGMNGVMDPRKFITEWRDWFLQEYSKYYGEVIAKIGSNFDAKKTIEKIQKVEGLENLKIAWALMSADERKDPEIVKVVKQMKKKYEKA